MNWIEARLKPGRHPSELYEYLDGDCLSFHHFWDEPWWEGAYVVRVWNPGPDPALCDAVDHVVDWNEEPDEELYGEQWPDVSAFFMAGSALAPLPPFEQRKLIHCLLNAQGMSWADEWRFHLRYVWRIPLLSIRWKLYLRRRWERECGPPVKEGEA